MKNISMKNSGPIQVYCGEACISNECNSSMINLSNHSYDQIMENVTTRFDRFIDTPQELPDRIIDLLHIASYVFCADRCASRGKRDSLSNSSWSRSWVFEIPVLDHDFWASPQVANALSAALVFMTGDKSFEFHFTKATHEPLKTEEYQTSLFSNSGLNIQRGKNIDVMLFSGGLDSLAGAIDRLNTFSDRQLCLINHMSNNRTIRTQRSLIKKLKEKYPDRVFPYTFECRFKKLKSRDETQRTRMFLFSAIAFAVCNYYSKDELFIYENGVTSLNLSKQTDVINARSSRTTHPNPTAFKVVGTTLNLTCCSEENDYALFNMDDGTDFYFPLGNSDSLKLGDPVKLIGYPNHFEGDSWELLKTDFKKKTQLFGHPLYEVTLPVRHGASGGVVLNEEDQIVGLICAGVESMDDSPFDSKQGFIPINTILQDVALQGC